MPMTDIWFSAMTIDAWCVAKEDSYIVKHCPFFHELAVEVKLRVKRNNLQRFPRHRLTMREKNVP